MKYTIELTDNQKNQMDLLCALAHQYIGFNPKLEKDIPRPMKESPAYNKGFEDGKLWAIDANTKDHQEYYDKGYNKALEDESELMAYITQDFINNCYPNDKGYNLYDLNAKYGLARVLKDYKTYKEKKKGEIKVGDEVKSVYDDLLAVVTKVNHDTGKIKILFQNGSGTMLECSSESYKKTGRHFDEVEQLLSKLQVS